MNGQGATGYCYYENVPQGEYAWVEKQGQFVDDEMEAAFPMRSVEQMIRCPTGI